MSQLIDYIFVVGPSGASADGSRPKVLEHLPKSVPWNKIDKATMHNLASMCLPNGSKEKVLGAKSTSFHSFLLTKEEGNRSWGHSLEFWNPSGGLSYSLLIITTRPLILTMEKILNYIYKIVLIDGLNLENFSKLLTFLFSLQDSYR